MKTIRFIFEVLFPGIISVCVAITFQWSWLIMLTLYIALSGFGHLIYLRIRNKEGIKEVLVKKHVICSLTLMLVGIAAIVMRFKQVTLIIGIGLLLVGIALIFGKLAEKANQGIKNYLVKKSKKEII